MTLKPEMLAKLHDDILVLLFPSKKKALSLDKGYKVMVQEQSFIYGRDANVKPMENVYKAISINNLNCLISICNLIDSIM